MTTMCYSITMWLEIEGDVGDIQYRLETEKSLMSSGLSGVVSQGSVFCLKGSPVGKIGIKSRFCASLLHLQAMRLHPGTPQDVQMPPEASEKPQSMTSIAHALLHLTG